MAPLKIASLLALIAVASCRTPGGAKRVIMDAEYIEEYEEALMSGELNEQYQATKDVKATQTSNSVEVRLHSSQAQVDLTVLDKRFVITGYDQSGLPKVTNYVAYEQYYDSLEWTVNTRGIHVIVLDRTGRILNYKAFDTYGSATNSAALVTYLNSIPAGRVLCFAVLDEGAINLDVNARNTITALGSKSIASLAHRDMWTFVTVKGGQVIGEAIQKKLPGEEWARDLSLRVNVPLSQAC